jgi:hypothetical protein
MRRGEAGVLMMIQYNQLQIAYMITSKRIVYHNYNATKKSSVLQARFSFVSIHMICSWILNAAFPVNQGLRPRHPVDVFIIAALAQFPPYVNI